jgi:hypothetical protein
MPQARSLSRWLGRWLSDVDDDATAEGLVHAGAPPSLVEALGGPGVGVIVEQPVNLGESVGRCLAGLLGVQRLRDRQGRGLAAAEASVELDLVGLGERDVLDQRAHDPFPLACWGRGV